MTKLEQRVMKVMRDNMENPEDLKDASSDLRENLHLDSIGTLMIVHGLEQDFSVSIDHSDFSQIQTIKDICDYLQRFHGIGENDA